MSDGKNLCDLKCEPCKGGVPPLTVSEQAPYLAKLDGWSTVEGHHLQKEYIFKNFREALVFVNQIGEIAEQEGHHPDIFLAWGKVGVKIWTHKIDGLSPSDFILAAKIDAV